VVGGGVESKKMTGKKGSKGKEERNEEEKE